MHIVFPGRRIRAVILAFVTLAAAAGCGKDGGSGLTDPPPSDDPAPADPAPSGWTGPAPVGHAIYAVDLGNNFLVFGSESFAVLTAKMRISGLPILRRIIGITVRPSDGKLYGVGNDSRVYTIDPYTAVATPVSSGPFSPKIASMFDIHFAMDLEPNGERVRLIAAESGANWSISLDDGTANSGETSHYAAGTELEGGTPRLLGMFYSPPADRADQNLCQNLAYAIDADEAIMIASCDPASGKWWPTVSDSQASSTSSAAMKLPRASSAGEPTWLRDLKDQLARCGEALPSPGVDPNNPDAPQEPRPPEGGPWFPRTPSTHTYLFLVRLGRNSIAEAAGLTPGVIVEPKGDIAADLPIQTAQWAGHGISHPPAPKLRQDLRAEAEMSVAGSQQPEPSTPPEPQGDPRARCM
jgi:Domain of unknown function (DUF4394)